jgi:hypothetical protein
MNFLIDLMDQIYEFYCIHVASTCIRRREVTSSTSGEYKETDLRSVAEKQIQSSISIEACD